MAEKIRTLLRTPKALNILKINILVKFSKIFIRFLQIFLKIHYFELIDCILIVYVSNYHGKVLYFCLSEIGIEIVYKYN